MTAPPRRTMECCTCRCSQCEPSRPRWCRPCHSAPTDPSSFVAQCPKTRQRSSSSAARRDASRPRPPGSVTAMLDSVSLSLARSPPACHKTYGSVWRNVSDDRGTILLHPTDPLSKATVLHHLGRSDSRHLEAGLPQRARHSDGRNAVRRRSTRHQVRARGHQGAQPRERILALVVRVRVRRAGRVVPAHQEAITVVRHRRALERDRRCNLMMPCQASNQASSQVGWHTHAA